MIPIHLAYANPILNDEINLSKNVGTSVSHQLATSGSDVYTVWDDDSTGNYEIFFRVSNNGGINFSNIINLSNSPEESTEPQIAVYGSLVYVVWQEGNSSNTDVFYRRSTDRGAHFETPINLSNLPTSSSPYIAVAGSNVYVAWYDNSSGNGEILFRKSTDRGVTFDPIINLSNNLGQSGLSFGTLLAAFDKNVYVAWSDDTYGNQEIFFRTSGDRGNSFGDVINISNSSSLSAFHQMSISGRNVYIVWYEETPGNSEIFFSASKDWGSTFSTPVNLSDTPSSSLSPQMVTSDTNVYVAWLDASLRNYAYDAFFRASNDGGASFGPVIHLGTIAPLSFSPMTMAASHNSVYVVWESYDDPVKTVLLRISNYKGVTFGSSIPISEMPLYEGSLDDVRIAESRGILYVMWAEALRVGGMVGNDDVFIRTIKI